MAADKVVGFTIEIRGTTEEREKMGQLSREILDTKAAIDKLKDATEGNLGAQKASADKMAQLQLQLKELNGEYKEIQTSILDNQKANNSAVGSYNELVAKNKLLSATLRDMPDAFNPANEAVKKLQKEMYDNTAQLKEFDAAMNRNFRNVGNYPKELNLASASMEELKAQITALKQATIDAGGSSTELGKEFSIQAQVIQQRIEEIALQQKTSVDIATASVDELRAAVKGFLQIASQAKEGTQEWADAIAKAGEAKGRITDLKEEVAALDPDKKAAAFIRMGASVVGAFGAMQGAAALFGSENETLNKTLVKIQATQAILAGIQSIADAKDEAAKLRIIFLERLANAEKERGIVVTNAATISQRLWNVAVGANLWIAFILVLAAVVVGIASYIQSTDNAKRAEIERSKAADGTVIKNKEVRDSYNELIKQTNEYVQALMVSNGQITELQAGINNLNNDKMMALTEAQNEYNASLAELGRSQQTQIEMVKQAKAQGYEIGSTGVYRGVLEIQKKLDDAKALAEQETQTKIAKIKQDQDLKDNDARIARLKTLGKTELQIKIDSINEQTKIDLANAKFTEKEKWQIEADGHNQIAKLLKDDLAQKIKDQEALTQKWKDEADKRLQTIKDNNKKIQDLTFQLQESNINLYKQGTEEELAASDLKYEKLRADLVSQKTTVFSKDKEIREQQLKMNQEIDDLITNSYRQQSKDRVDITTKSNAEVLKATLDLYDAETEIAVYQAQRESKNEHDKNKDILQIKIDADKKKLELLQAQGNAEDIETKKQIEQLKTDIYTMTAEYNKPENTVLAKALGVTDEQAKLIDDKVFELMKKSSDAIFNAEKERVDRISKYKIDALSNDHDTQTKMLQSQLDQNVISQQQFNQQKAVLDRQFEAAKQAEDKKAFEKKKKLALEQIAVDLAQGLLKIQVDSLASPQSIATGGIAGVSQAALLSAIAIADAGLQAAIIGAQKFATGGMILGAGDGTSDSVPVMASNGESIINAKSTKMFAPLLSEINYAGGGRRFASGGIPLPAPNYNTAQYFPQGITRDEAADMIIHGLNTQRVAVLESDITDQQKKSQVIERSTRW